MLNTALQVLSKDGSIADNTYQVIDEDGVLPQGDVVLTVEQLDQLAQVSGKKALLVTVDASPETHEFPLDQLDAILRVLTMVVVIHLQRSYVAKVSKVNYVQQVMCLKMS